MNKWFAKFSSKASDVTGSSWAFLAAAAIILAWAITGPIFNFSDTWQLVINTGTTIVTFLMVFLIQNTQNRDAKAIHLKLDEIIHVIGAAHNELIDVENLSDEELRKILSTYSKIAHNEHQKGDLEEALANCQEPENGAKASSNGKGSPEQAVRAVREGVAS